MSRRMIHDNSWILSYLICDRVTFFVQATIFKNYVFYAINSM